MSSQPLIPLCGQTGNEMVICEYWSSPFLSLVFQLSSMVHCVHSIKINLIVRRGLLARVAERISCVHLPGSM